MSILKNYLDFLADLGVDETAGLSPFVLKKVSENTSEVKHLINNTLNNTLNTISNVDNVNNLAELKDSLSKINTLEIQKFATNTVIGEGVETSSIMLIGEAPGEEEDRQGRPFCGKSGILLDAAFETIGISRKTNCYITNTVFWRPPGNRNPTDEELHFCRPFLEKIIDLINPKLIICVGSISAKQILQTNEGITKLRSKFFKYKNIDCVAIYHPSYLLRSPFKKKEMYLDLLKIQQFIKQINA